MSISTELRKAAMGPTPGTTDCLCSWVSGYGGAYCTVVEYIDVSDMADDRLGYLGGLTECECRMFLLFCSYAAEDEGK